MHKVLVLGAGRIGPVVALFLARSGDYQVVLADIHISKHVKQILAKEPQIELVDLDINDVDKVLRTVRATSITTLISCLPYYCNVVAAKLAAKAGLNYFDLTEDITTIAEIHTTASQSESLFVPQCGLAPGLVSIIGQGLIHDFDQVAQLSMRVGAVPMNVSNPLNYALTWSTEGLINEYANPCQAVQNGKIVDLTGLEGIEELKIDGVSYEAFNTSGGVATLMEKYAGKVNNMSYKTIRYRGHCEKMRFLMHGLRLNEHRNLLRQVLENAVPRTSQDMVLIYISAEGTREDDLYEENYSGRFFPQKIYGHVFSATQVACAFSLCSVVDLIIREGKYHEHGPLIKQETISFKAVLGNRFGKYFAMEGSEQLGQSGVEKNFASLKEFCMS